MSIGVPSTGGMQEPRTFEHRNPLYNLDIPSSYPLNILPQELPQTWSNTPGMPTQNSQRHTNSFGRTDEMTNHGDMQGHFSSTPGGPRHQNLQSVTDSRHANSMGLGSLTGLPQISNSRDIQPQNIQHERGTSEGMNPTGDHSSIEKQLPFAPVGEHGQLYSHSPYGSSKNRQAFHRPQLSIGSDQLHPDSPYGISTDKQAIRPPQSPPGAQ